MNKATIISELKRALTLTIPFFETEPGFLQKSYGPGKAASRVGTDSASSKRSGTRGGTKKLICRWLFSWWSFDRCFFSRWFLGRALDILLFRSSTTGSDSRGPFMCGLSRYRSA